MRGYGVTRALTAAFVVGAVVVSCTGDGDVVTGTSTTGPADSPTTQAGESSPSSSVGESSPSSAVGPDTSADQPVETDLRSWVVPFCESSADFLRHWEELDGESDWLSLAEDIDTSMSGYLESLNAMETPSFAADEWVEFLDVIAEQAAEARTALEEVREMEPDELERDLNLHPSVDLVGPAWFFIGSFVQGSELQLGSTIGGPDSEMDAGANFIPACDELSEIWWDWMYG